MITPNQRVEKVFENGELSSAFGFATDIGTGGSHSYFFSQIYAPIKVPTSEGMPDSWTYVNIGLDNTELSQIYNTYYGRNYLIRDTALKLFPYIQGVFKKNKYKYMRMIEIQGYTFNPLWNVDADERYAHIDTHGEKKNTITHKIDETTTHDINQDVLNYSRPFDSASNPTGTLYDTKTNTSGNTTNNRTGLAASNVDIDTETHTALKDTIEGTEANITVSDDLNPLEFNVPEIDDLHVERHIRSGNIGVTKSTELLQDAIEYVRNNVIAEFFKDINEVILIGVFDAC